MYTKGKYISTKQVEKIYFQVLVMRSKGLAVNRDSRDTAEKEEILGHQEQRVSI